MAETNRRFPPLYLLACIFLVAGTAGLCVIFFLPLPPQTFQGSIYVCLALVLFGTGEIVNHPKEKVSTGYTGQQANQAQQFQRRRNSCSLGNLLGIGALLLFFIGLSALLFPN